MSEILAPAGGVQALYAAVRNGADAVYLGSENFNARRNAENFSDAELDSLVEYCHIHGVKVYHTLNTLVKDREIGGAAEELKRILNRHEDALILQDLGLVKIARSLCPDIPLHASTQLSVHNVAGAKALEEMGFSRVVAAREMSRKELEYLRENTRLEIEVFVHGALCMCVSGQCYLSSMLGGRSGNRGLCAQPCRLAFAADSGTGYDLSLKDNSLLKYLKEMADAGIDSFKIEGRMKRPEYVAASVRACRRALEGKETVQETEELKNIFSRQGFTDGYYTSKTGRNMFGTRTYDDVAAADGLTLKKYASTYEKEIQTIPCTIQAEVRENAFPKISLTAKGKTFVSYGEEMPEKAQTHGIDEDEIKARLSKLGGTPYIAENISVTADAGIFLRAGSINALRRSAAEGMNKLLAQREPYSLGTMPEIKESSKKKISESGKKRFYYRFSSLLQAESAECAEADKIIIPLDEAVDAAEFFGAERLAVEIPRVCFDMSAHIDQKLKETAACGIKEAACGNIGSVYTARKVGMKILGFWGMNIFNSYSLAELQADESLLSFEMSNAEINAIKSESPLGVIAYGHMPLMITRNCPVRNGKTCAECGNSSHLTDRKNKKFEVRCIQNCSELFNPYALYMLDKTEEFRSVDFFVLYFTYENREEIKKIIESSVKSSPPSGAFTRGLYGKGVM